MVQDKPRGAVNRVCKNRSAYRLCAMTRVLAVTVQCDGMWQERFPVSIDSGAGAVCERRCSAVCLLCDGEGADHCPQ